MALEKKTEKLSMFSYIATNPSSGVVRGELRAIGQDSAMVQLERMGLEPISVSERKESILDMQITFFEKVPPTDIYNFTRQLSVMLKAGFVQHPNEWWHFSYGDQLWAWKNKTAFAIYGLCSPS